MVNIKFYFFSFIILKMSIINGLLEILKTHIRHNHYFHDNDYIFIIINIFMQFYDKILRIYILYNKLLILFKPNIYIYTLVEQIK